MIILCNELAAGSITGDSQCSCNIVYIYLSLKPETFTFQCLVTCGKGYKHRQTWCQFGEDRLDDRFCGSAKPESVQTCQQQECASWQVGPWGQVSNPCVTVLYSVQFILYTTLCSRLLGIV